MTVSSLPIWAVDVVGSVCMILLSIFCLFIAGKLHHRDRNNIIWTYLFWVCTALTVFAVSRSAGHSAMTDVAGPENHSTDRG